MNYVGSQMRHDQTGLEGLATLSEQLSSVAKRIEIETTPFHNLNDCINSAVGRIQLLAVVDQLFNNLEVTRNLVAHVHSNVLPSMSALTRMAEDARHLTEIYNRVDFLKASNLIPLTDTLSRIARDTLNAGAVLQNIHLSGLLERLVSDQLFRENLIRHLAPVYASHASTEATELSEVDLLYTLEDGIDQSNLLEVTGDSEAATRRFADWLERLPLPIGQAILTIILGLFTNFLYDCGKGWVTNTSPKEQVKVTQVVARKLVVNAKVPNSERRKVKVVSTDIGAWISNRRDAEKIANLTAGQIVIVHYKKRKWSFVMWIDSETHEERRGWTLTRYLKPI